MTRYLQLVAFSKSFIFIFSVNCIKYECLLVKQTDEEQYWTSRHQFSR